MGDNPPRGAVEGEEGERGGEGERGPHSPLVLVAQPGLWYLVCLVLPAQARGQGESPPRSRAGATGASAYPGQFPASRGDMSQSPPGVMLRPSSPPPPRAGRPRCAFTPCTGCRWPVTGRWHSPRSRAALGGRRDPASQQGPGDPQDPSCQEHPLRLVRPAGTEEPGDADPVRSSAAPLGSPCVGRITHLCALLALTALGARGAGWTLRRGETVR